jgi:hypothetical protein
MTWKPNYLTSFFKMDGKDNREMRNEEVRIKNERTD